MRLPLAGVLALLAAAPAAAADTTIATLDRPTEVRAYAGIAVFSVHQEAGYRLAVARGAEAPQLLDVAPRPVPFDADIGPDSAGRAAIVYSRCATEGERRRDCDVFRYSLTSGTEAQVTTTDADDASEVRPTLWKGRIAWVRTYDDRPRGKAYIYTRALTAPRRVRSERLPGAPPRRCGIERCGPTSLIADPEIELYGRWLGLIVRYSYPGAPGVCGRWEVRLDDLRGGPARRLGDHVCGLDGQTAVGVSFDAGHMAFARVCIAAPGDCTFAEGAFRYRMSDDTFERAPFGRRLRGFAYAGGDRAYEVRAPDTPQGYCGNALPGTAPPCQVVRADGLRFSRVRAPR